MVTVTACPEVMRYKDTETQRTRRLCAHLRPRSCLSEQNQTVPLLCARVVFPTVTSQIDVTNDTRAQDAILSAQSADGVFCVTHLPFPARIHAAEQRESVVATRCRLLAYDTNSHTAQVRGISRVRLAHTWRHDVAWADVRAIPEVLEATEDETSPNHSLSIADQSTRVREDVFKLHSKCLEMVEQPDAQHVMERLRTVNSHSADFPTDPVEVPQGHDSLSSTPVSACPPRISVHTVSACPPCA